MGTVIQEALQKSEQQSIPLYPRFLSDPCSQTLCARAVGMSGATVLCFISGWWLGLQISNALPYRGALRLALFSPRKQSVGAGVVMHSEKLQPGYQFDLVPDVEGLLNSSWLAFCPCRGKIASSKILQEGELSLPV